MSAGMAPEQPAKPASNNKWIFILVGCVGCMFLSIPVLFIGGGFVSYFMVRTGVGTPTYPRAVSAQVWSTTVSSCTEICDRALACNVGKFNGWSDCKSTCDAAEEGTPAETFDCIGDSLSCTAMKSCE